MIPLLLAIISSASIALVFRYTESRDLNRFAVTAANYVTAALCSCVVLLVGSLPEMAGTGGLAAEFSAVIAGGEGEFSARGSFQWALAVGLVTGCFFFSGFIFYQIAVRQNGVGLAGAFGRLGMLLPVAVALIVWRDLPTLMQGVGMVLAFFAIAAVNWPADGEWRGALRVSLLALFLLAGLSEFSHALFQKYALDEFKGVFLLATFSMASLISIAAILVTRSRFGWKDCLCGVAVGLPNFFSSYFLVMALETVPSALAYPLFSAGAIVLIAVGGFLIYGERPKPIEAAAIALTVVAMVLVNF